jgi:large subunit ribosomal protein L25
VSEIRITAEPRTEFGKGAARRTRRANKVPAVLYGHGTEPEHVSLPGHDLMMALKTPNVLLRVDGLKGGEQLVLPKSVQRDPVKGFIEHVDLILVRRGEKVVVEVPLETVGTPVPGGLLDHDLVALSVSCEATHIPTSIELDVQGLAIGAAIHAKDVVLPSGVELATDPETLVVNVLAAPTAAQLEGIAPEEAEAAEETPAG